LNGETFSPRFVSALEPEAPSHSTFTSKATPTTAFHANLTHPKPGVTASPAGAAGGFGTGTGCAQFTKAKIDKITANISNTLLFFIA